MLKLGRKSNKKINYLLSLSLKFLLTKKPTIIKFTTRTPAQHTI